MAKNRQKIVFYILAFITVFIVGRIFPAPAKPTTDNRQQPTNAIVAAATTTTSPSSLDAPNTQTALTSPISQNIPTSPTYPVVSVTDGDTIKVNIDGMTKTLRIIGLDTPETVDPTKPVQCYGPESSAKARELLNGKSVKLESDPTQGELDKYNRLLRYVFLTDGTDYGKLMISQGFAHEYTYKTAYKYQADYKAAESAAKATGLGFWSASSCNGDTTQAVTKNSSSSTTPTTLNSPTTQTSSANVTSTNPDAGLPGPTKTPPDPNCPIKGNISSGGKIYHIPGGASYAATVIDQSAGERWFCTESDALAAGWRKSLK